MNGMRITMMEQKKELQFIEFEEKQKGHLKSLTLSQFSLKLTGNCLEKFYFFFFIIAVAASATSYHFWSNINIKTKSIEVSLVRYYPISQLNERHR